MFTTERKTIASALDKIASAAYIIENNYYLYNFNESEEIEYNSILAELDLIYDRLDSVLTRVIEL